MPYLTYCRLFHDLDAAGITVRVVQGGLMVGPAAKLTPELRQGLADLKAVWLMIDRDDEKARRRTVKA